MDEKTLKLKEKKLRLEYRFLSAEMEEVEHILKEADEEIKKVFKKDLSKIQKQTEAISPGAEPEPEEKPVLSRKSKETKSIYYKIVAATHPDKVGDNSLEDLFKEAVKAYKSGDICALYDIADDLNIPLSNMSRKQILLMEDKNKKISKEIKNKKSSFGWKWATAESDEEREELKKAFCDFHGVKDENSSENN